jgi:hypothetical protein
VREVYLGHSSSAGLIGLTAAEQSDLIQR